MVNEKILQIIERHDEEYLRDADLTSERGYLKACLKALYSEAINVREDKDWANMDEIMKDWKNVDEIIVPELISLELSEENEIYLHTYLFQKLMDKNRHIRDATISLYGKIDIPDRYYEGIIDKIIEISKSDEWVYNREMAIEVLGRYDIKTRLDSEKQEIIKETLEYIIKNDNNQDNQILAKEKLESYKT